MANPQLSASSEFLANYKAATIMPADAVFSALQTTEGHALLFSVGTDGICYFTQEKPGSKAGWQKTDLSSALAASDAIAAKKLAVAQNAATANIHMALATTTSADDALHLSLGNSAADTSWAGTPRWTAIPFDDPSRPFSGQLVINDIFVSEASDGEYIVVDVLQQADSGTPTIFRYFIDPNFNDPTKAITGQAWNQHDVAGDIDATTVSSALGRSAPGGVVPQPGDPVVDGLYTMGSIAGQPQLIYQPLYNLFAPGQAAAPSRLGLPGGGLGSAIAAVRRPDNCTDLFVASGQSMYFFAAENQDDGATGVSVLNGPMYAGVTQLFASRSKTQVILWGLNAAHQVFYTSCAIDNVLTGPWSTPLPLRSGVHQLAPYVNRANDANNFFLHTGADTLQRAAQARDTTTWNYDLVRLPPPDKAKATRASSFTTRLQVNDAKGGPLANTPVQISALHRVGVDINGFYQVLDTTPIPVNTDANGAVNIIEWVARPRATPLRVTGPDGTTIAVNPMANVLKQAASPRSGPRRVGAPPPEMTPDVTVDCLTDARVPNKDGTISDRPLVPTGANAPSSDDLDAAASAIGHLATIYPTLPADGSVKAPAAAAFAAGSMRRITIGRVHTVGQGPGRALHDQFRMGMAIGIGGVDLPGVNWIESHAGDVLSAIEDAPETVVSVVEDAASGAWHFVATIAGQIYSFVLDAAEKVVGALVAIYNAIKAFVEDVIAWLEFLMEWGDFKRSMHVCKQVVWLNLNFLNDHAKDLKPAFNQLFDDARSEVDAWAGVKHSDAWAGSVDHHDKPPAFVRTLIDVSSGFTSPAMYFYHHLADNLSGGSGDGGNGVDGPYEAALAVLTNQADTMVAALGQIETVVTNVGSLNLEDALKQITAIVVDAFLQGTNDVGDALLDLLAAATQAAIDALQEHVHIPVISDILEDVFGDSSQFTLLEFILMAGAIPGTLLYKSAAGSMPFSSGDGFTDEIQDSDTLEEFLAKLSPPAPSNVAMMAVAARDIGGSIEGGFDALATAHLEGRPAKSLFVVCHAVAGAAQMLNAVWVGTAVEGADMTVWWDRMMSAVCGLVSGLALAASSVLTPPNPIKNEKFESMQKVISIMLFALKAVCLATADTPIKEKVGAFADSYLAISQFPCTCYHFYELSGEDASTSRSAAYVDETTTVITCVARLLQDLVVIHPEMGPDTFAAAVVATLDAAGLDFANAGVMANS